MSAFGWTVLILGTMIFWAAIIGLKYWLTHKAAREIYDARSGEDKLIGALNFEEFAKIYQRTNGPRPAIFAFLAAASALILMPLIFNISTWIMNILWNASGRAQDFDEGFAPWLFVITLLIIAGWIVVGGVFARLYYLNKPKSLEKELLKFQEQQL